MPLSTPGELNMAVLYTSVKEYTSPEPLNTLFTIKPYRPFDVSRYVPKEKKIILNTVFAGQFVGIREVSDKI